MNEMPPFQPIIEDDVAQVKSKFEDVQVFKNIAELVGHNESLKHELNRQISAYLQRLIFINLKLAFKNSGRQEEFESFILGLVSLKSGKEQIIKIDVAVAPVEAEFWANIELQLRDGLLEKIIESLEKRK